MALVLKDRVKETSVSTGTGAITLDGASGAFQPFSVIGDGNTTYYAIAGQASTEWEVGIGTYTLSTDSLSRDTILASSNSNTIVTFSAGTKDVFVTYPSEKAIYEEPSGETLINAGPITVIGAGVTSIPSLPAELGKFVGDVNSFAQIYTFNQNGGATASADFVAYNDLTTDGYTYFTDMGINSSNYTSVDYPIFTPNSGYNFHDGDNYYIGAATANKDVVIFAGGVDVTDTVATFSGTNLSTTLEGALDVATTLDVGGAATFGSTVLLNADPSLNLQAATKQYVDNAVAAGLEIHTPVRLEQGANLSATYDNGTAGVGATLTNAGTQIALSVDGVATVVNDRILVYGQTTATQNGVYTVTDIGSGATNWVLTRATDADTYGANDPTKLSQGAYFYVTSGMTGAGESYVLSTVGVIVFGTTALTFSQFSASPTYVGGTNINITGQTISLTGTVAATNGGTGTATVTTGDLLYGSASNTWSKLALGAGYKSLVVNAGGTQLEWNAVALDQSGAVSGALGATNGGTGQSGYTVGDTLYSGTTNTLSKLAGNTSTTKQFLSQTGTGSASQAPAWASISATDIQTGTLPATRGGTDNSSYAIGDILYADTTTSLARLADVATGNALISGGLSAAPSWGKIALASAVSGTLPVANGGTGVTTSTGSGNVVLSTSPTLVTPALGTPSSGNLANCTFPTLNQNTTGSAATLTTGRTIAITGDLTYTSGSFDGSANVTGTGTLANTAVTPGSYTYASVTVDSKGRLTAASSGASPSAFPSGTVMLFVQTAAPTGWTKSVTHDNKALRVVSGTASSGGSVAFTTAFASQAVAGSVGTSGSTTATNQATTAGGSVGGSFTVGATTLSTAQMPSHTHSAAGASGNAATTAESSLNACSPASTDATGGGGSHTHSISGSPSFTGTSHNHTQDAHTHTGGAFTGTAINLAVQYVDTIIAVKD